MLYKNATERIFVLLYWSRRRGVMFVVKEDPDLLLKVSADCFRPNNFGICFLEGRGRYFGERCEEVCVESC